MIKQRKILHSKIMHHLNTCASKLLNAINYSMTSSSLWNYYRDGNDHMDDNASDGRSFKYKKKMVGETPKRPPLP